MKFKALVASLITCLWAFSASAVSVTQTVDFPEILGFDVYSNQPVSPTGWSAPFPFTSISEITDILFEFTTTDPDFFAGIGNGPFGGDPGVEFDILIGTIPTRIGISPFVAGAQTFPLSAGFDPYETFDTNVAQLILNTGGLQLSLGGWENFFGTSQLPQIYDDPSAIMITVTGTVPEPSTAMLMGLGLTGLLVMGRKP